MACSCIRCVVDHRDPCGGTPAGAAHVIHNIGTFLTSAAHGLSNFFAGIGSVLKGKDGKSGTDWGGIIIGGIVGGMILVICIWAAVDRIRNKK